MGFSVYCNWCGTTLYNEDMARLTVEIQRNAQTKLDARWAVEARPTLHFCVKPKVDFGRMGLSADDHDDAGSCYARAIATINGEETESPDMGLEWRLVPVDAPEREERPRPNRVVQPVRTVQGRPDPLAPFRAQIGKWADGLGDPRANDSIETLYIRVPTHTALRRAGIETVEDLIHVIEHDALSAVRGIGVGRAQEIGCALDRHFQRIEAS